MYSSVAIAPDRRQAIAVDSLNNIVRLLDLEGQIRGVSSVACSPDGRLALTAGRDAISIVWPAFPR